MIKVLALDDEPLALQQLLRYLGKIPFFEVVGGCLGVSEAMKILSETKVDALFLDINMPDLNGLEFVTSLVKQPLTVFTTAYSEYAVEGYKVNAVDYLLKPYGLSDIQRAANKVRQRYELEHPVLPPASEPVNVDHVDDDVIFLKTDYKVVRINVSEIVYIKGMSEYMRIYTAGQPKPVIALLSMKRMEDRLAGKQFMRVHRSFIVNLDHIHELGRAGIVLDTGEEIPIGDTYRPAFNEYIKGLTMNN